MANLEEILFGKKSATQDESSDHAGGEAIKGTAEWAKNNSGESAGGEAIKGTAEWTQNKSGENADNDSSSDDSSNNATVNPDKSGGSATSSSEAEGGYSKILQTMYPDMEMTEEQKQKALKKEKREKIIAALGDGLSTLANIYFTSQYAPYVAPKSSLSKAVQEKYDKADKEKKWYMEKKMEAQSKDDEKADKERAWRRQLGIDEENRQWRKDQTEAQKEAAALAREQFSYKMSKDAEEAEDRKEKNDIEWAKLDYRKAEEKRRANREKRKDARQRARDRIALSDGKGNEVSIHKDVMAGSMQEVFNILVEDGIGNTGKDSKDTQLYQMMMSRMTPTQQEDFIKKHWTKSPKAAALMLHLSTLDPSNMKSAISEEDSTPPSMRGGSKVKDDDDTPPSMRKK